MMIETVSQEISSFVEEELNYILNFLMKKYGLKAGDAKQLIKEILATSI